ncbi:MAG: DNA alkylation repair protein [Clostridia bacterium]|nr:DNA alkylation repair protein [Clostridia bacterium]
MNLIKDIWNKGDVETLNSYLLSFSKGKEKGEWEKRIVNTSLPCIAVPSQIVTNIIKKIAKGNYISLIELFPWQNHSMTVIIGGLICKIKDFNMFKKYLNIYANKIDNWASCDTLKFKINKNNQKEFFNLAEEYIKSEKPFVRRVGLLIIFKMIGDSEYIDKIFKILNLFYNEKEYYVNMMLSWILCECFIKHRDKTIEFLKNNNLNKFVINKGISKCRDSFRVSCEDKEMLKRYKEK